MLFKLIKPKHYFILAFLWFILILFLSLIPNSTPDKIQFVNFEMRLDYLLHFLIYLPLGFALMKWSMPKRNNSKYFYAIILFLTYSILPELVQYFIPYRTFNPYDLLFNISGMIVGCLIVVSINRRNLHN